MMTNLTRFTVLMVSSIISIGAMTHACESGSEQERVAPGSEAPFASGDSPVGSLQGFGDDGDALPFADDTLEPLLRAIPEVSSIRAGAHPPPPPAVELPVSMSADAMPSPPPPLEGVEAAGSIPADMRLSPTSVVPEEEFSTPLAIGAALAAGAPGVGSAMLAAPDRAAAWPADMVAVPQPPLVSVLSSPSGATIVESQTSRGVVRRRISRRVARADFVEITDDEVDQLRADAAAVEPITSSDAGSDASSASSLAALARGVYGATAHVASIVTPRVVTAVCDTTATLTEAVRVAAPVVASAVCSVTVSAVAGAADVVTVTAPIVVAGARVACRFSCLAAVTGANVAVAGANMVAGAAMAMADRLADEPDNFDS